MSKIVVVTNAEVQNWQGNIVCRALSEAGYTVRALVSDIESPGSIALAKLNNVHVILDDQSSPLDETFDNVWAIYCNSLPSWDNMLASPGEKKVDDELNEGEFEQGKRWADAAKKAGIKIIVWATLPDISKTSKGKYPNIAHFQDKVKVQEYMKSLDLPVVFVSPGQLMENFVRYFLINLEDDKVTVQFARSQANDHPLYLIYMDADFGSLVKTIIEEFETCQLKHKTIVASGQPISMNDILKTLSKVLGKEAVLKSLPFMVTEGSDVDEMAKFINDPEFKFFEDDQIEFSHAFFKATGIKFHSFEAFLTLYSQRGLI